MNEEEKRNFNLELAEAEILKFLRRCKKLKEFDEIHIVLKRKKIVLSNPKVWCMDTSKDQTDLAIKSLESKNLIKRHQGPLWSAIK